MKFASLALCGATLLCRAASAAPETLPLTPATTKLGLTVFALGFFPLPGQYERFSGTLETDRARPGFCRVSVVVDQASLTMADPAHARKALAADMLDAARFPTMRFAGSCVGNTIAGMLTLHGVTHPLVMALTRDGVTVAGAGRLNRREYGVDGIPHLLGQMIRIHFLSRLPAH